MPQLFSNRGALSKRDKNFSAWCVVTGFDIWIKTPLPAKSEGNLTWNVYATHAKDKDGSNITEIFIISATDSKLTEIILLVKLTTKTSKPSLQAGSGASLETNTMESSKAMQEYAMAVAAALTGVPSAQFTSTGKKTEARTKEDIQAKDTINPNPPASNTASTSNNSISSSTPDQSSDDNIHSRAMKVISTLSSVEESEINSRNTSGR